MRKPVVFRAFPGVLLVGLIILLSVAVRARAGGNFDLQHRWAWSSSAGWINFHPTYPDQDPALFPRAYPDHLEGYLWAENLGYIRLGSYGSGGLHTYANTSPADYGVNRNGRYLSGYAWSTTTGWIRFDPLLGGVSLDPATGILAGYAWAENTGWVRFNETDAYKVELVQSSISPTARWAWGTNLGWIDFHPAGYEKVAIYPDHLEGYAWAENAGWVRLGSYSGGGQHTYANTSGTDYGVNLEAGGQLTGYAWSSTVGWIDFAPAYGGVSLDPATGLFSGFAWAENVGWIRFQPTSTNTYALAGHPLYASNGAGGGSWSLPATWSAGAVPPASGSVTIASGDTVVLDGAVQVYDLALSPGATLAIPAGASLQVDGLLYNQGTLQQTLPVDGSTTPTTAKFMEIYDSSHTVVRYRGVDIQTAADLGVVTVSVRDLNAGEFCASTGAASPPYVRRCFDIQAAEQPARLRLWAYTSQADQIPANQLRVYHASGGNWVQLPDPASVATGDGYLYAEGPAASYSSFLIGGDSEAPTALTWVGSSAGRPRTPWLLICALAALGLAILWVGRRKLRLS